MVGRPPRGHARAVAEWAALLKRSRKARHRERTFFVEGVRAIDRARARGYRAAAWLYAGERPLSDWARGILDAAPRGSRFALPADTLRELSDKEAPSELLALMTMPALEPGALRLGDPPLLVAVDRPRSPGNLGALLRTCDAFGVDALLVIGHACDLYDPRTVRASAGSLFTVPAVALAGARQLGAFLDDVRGTWRDLVVLGSSARAVGPPAESHVRGGTALVLGNEATGLGTAMRALCDDVVGVRMRGDATSLNVTSAAAILLHEVQRLREAIL